MGLDTPGGAAAPPPHPFAPALVRAVCAAPGGTIALFGYGSGRNLPPLLGARLAVDIFEPDAARAIAATSRHGGDARVRIVAAPAGLAAALAAVTACRAPYAGALSTHGLLHGTVAEIRAAIAALHARLAADAPFYTTLGSTRDPRYGAGRRIAPGSYAPASGSEAGVVHAYFDEAGARAALHGFRIDALDEGPATEAGAWAHAPEEAATLRHFFIRARRVQ